ncbi:PREDICTED: prion-like-(Q/N-rich) domain-bearing protein 25 isoform X2 [Polistes dominula]|uniref:Prion-like-(Q/N-rich) domain-bearing protein 25 isoform X2 n=1 Tax=Polistes dominula TaxID=743375 RepID=A0ABM1HTE1_POLDO|nr:PREDICTED: prion-like-(Q/N-rich) domain-bearing protein 25 isoform X2 [Polistes dominula]
MLLPTNSTFIFLLIIQIVFHSEISVNSYDNPSENNDVSTNKIEWNCKSDFECTAKGSVCKNEQCQCTSGYVYNSDMSSCLPVANNYGDKCNETIQCSRYLFIGGQCIENACVCGQGFYYLHGRCYKTVELGKECRINDDCHINSEFGSTVCDNGICKCRDGFYQREYRSCRKKANLGEECVVDIDCKFNEGAYCNDICTIDQEEINYNIISQTTYNLFDRKFADENDMTTELNNCTKNSDCEIYENAICGSRGKCVCKRAYYVSSSNDKIKVCVPELGQPCENKNSTNPNIICKNDTWNCANKKLPSKNNQECLKATRKYNNSCQRDEQCSIFGPDAICKNNRCLCNDERSHFVEKLQFCWRNKGINDTCYVDEDCYVKEFNGTLVCTNNSCNCPEGTHLNSDKTTCLNINAELGMVCEYDEHCKTSNSVCVNNICVCNNTYYEFEKQCYAGVNATCTLDYHCTPTHTFCSFGVCTCKEGYIGSSTSTCLPTAQYGEECSEDIQCNVITPNSICSWNPNYSNSSIKTCICGDDRYFRHSSCPKKKLLGESCTSYIECYLDSNQNRAICMNGLCSCNWQYVQVNDTICLKNNVEKLMAVTDGAIETFSRSCLAILSISLILLLDLIR